MAWVLAGSWAIIVAGSGVEDVLEGNYGGDPTKMPYVVNKEAFIP
jgi:hypothetical protein